MGKKLFTAKQTLKDFMGEKETIVKFIKELDFILQDEEVDERDRKTSLTLCECMKCHWKFIGGCERHGEGVQIPYFCPMCGSKISEILEDQKE